MNKDVVQEGNLIRYDRVTDYPGLVGWLGNYLTRVGFLGF